MNIWDILKLFEKSLSQWKSLYKGDKLARRFVRYQMRNKSNLKMVAQQAFGGKDLFPNLNISLKDLKPKKQKTKAKPKEKKVREYVVTKMWKSMSDTQKKQFREWFRKQAMSQARVARSFTLENELRKLQRKVTRISNKYFVNRKKLTKSELDYITTFSEFFGETDNPIGAKPIGVAAPKREPWYRTRSSWLLAFRYIGEKGKNENGNLMCRMIRSNKTYHFPNFPYVEYVLLKNCSGSIGKYWWKKWLWRYSTNPTRWNKYWYKGRPRYGK